MLSSLLPSWISGAGAKTDAAESSQEASHDDESAETTDGETTPKAKPEAPTSDVPTFALSETSHPDDEPEPEPDVPMFPAANSAQRASATPSGSSAPRTSPASLMPPPPRPGLAPPAGRMPTTGPLPNRGPPAASQQRVSASRLSSGSATKTSSNGRGKVLLAPGHSPMDWAALTRTGNVSGVATFQRVTPSELRRMTGRKGKPAWSAWQGKVYNITPYLPFHPGGEAELMKAAGRDGTKLFLDVHPWVNWENMLGACLVGVLVPEDYAQSALEDMD